MKLGFLIRAIIMVGGLPYVLHREYLRFVIADPGFLFYILGSVYPYTKKY